MTPASRTAAPRTKRVPELTADEITALRALRPAFNGLLRALDADLIRSDGLSHAEYLVLMYLSEAKDRTLRISDLAAVCQQSLSGLSRTVTRLEAEGLVKRQQAAHDARSFHVVLSPDGRARFRAAQPGHLESVRRHFFDHLGDLDLRGLGKALEEIASATSGLDARRR
jgi:DNA-binding MarR family transcriptional regulator